MTRNPLRQCLAIALSAACPAATVWGQDIRPLAPARPAMVRPYFPVTVPAARLTDSTRLRTLIRAGILYLSAQDAIALALENNIDIEVSRYSAVIAEWQLKRVEAGGALAGVTSSASQAGSVASGQGVTGSQSAAGLRSSSSQGSSGGTNASVSQVGGALAGVTSSASQAGSVASGQGVTGSQSAAGLRSGSSQSSSGSTNASVSQVGPVTQTLDPSFQEASTFSHTSSPQANATQSLTNNLITATRVYTGTFKQGFLSGGNVTVTYSDNFLRENSPTDVLNPSTATKLTLSVQHNLLQGFGTAVNGRTITVSRIGIGTSDLNFKKQVTQIATQVLNAYYSLVADRTDLSAKRRAAEVAEAFVQNVQRQITLGAAADADLITAQSQAVTAQQALVDADATLRQQELTLKGLLSRTGTVDPLFASARILPVDNIAIPEKDDLAPVSEMLRMAVANRPDLAVDKINEQTGEISALGTRNGLLPTLQVQASTSQSGLAGTARSVSGYSAPDPYFVGGVGSALGQVFRRDFPTNSVSVFFYTQLGNNQAQADFAVDRLQNRQTQLTTRKDLAQVEVDIMNSVIAIQQSRARYDAAVRNRILQEQLFASEQKKYELGASTPFLVTQQQRDLTNAQTQELSATVTYITARIALDGTLGATLENNRVQIDDARSGKVARTSSLPVVDAVSGDRR